MNSIVTIIGAIAALITGIGTIIAVPKSIIRARDKKREKERLAMEKDQKQDADIQRLKEENCLIVFGLSACLDGLQQLGCNHTVTTAKDKIDKYRNQQAHK